MHCKYVIVTPVKDEEKHLPYTVESVLTQEVRPEKWIIVNDGSKDRTAQILATLAAEHSWINVLETKQSKHSRRIGGQAAVYLAFDTLRVDDYDFIVRMDGDISFPPSYFARLFSEFGDNPKLGIGSGICYVREGRRLVEERHPRFHTRGPLKTYRMQCFKDIGGLDKNEGWDTIDEVKANMLGWQTRSFADLRIIHLRKTQTASGVLRGMMNMGRVSYYTAYHPIYAMLRAGKKTAQPPYVIGGLAFLAGYVEGYIRHSPRVDDQALIRYLRRQQITRLLGRETIWK